MRLVIRRSSRDRIGKMQRASDIHIYEYHSDSHTCVIYHDGIAENEQPSFAVYAQCIYITNKFYQHYGQSYVGLLERIVCVSNETAEHYPVMLLLRGLLKYICTNGLYVMLESDIRAPYMLLEKSFAIQDRACNCTKEHTVTIRSEYILRAFKMLSVCKPLPCPPTVNVMPAEPLYLLVFWSNNKYTPRYSWPCKYICYRFTENTKYIHGPAHYTTVPNGWKLAIVTPLYERDGCTYVEVSYEISL